MSCGEEHETHCNEVLAEVWLFLDQECDQGRWELLRRHLDECNPCLAAYGIEEKLKQLLARKCGGEHAPNELRDRLREQIRAAVLAQVRSAITVEQTQVTVEVRGTQVERRSR